MSSVIQSGSSVFARQWLTHSVSVVATICIRIVVTPRNFLGPNYTLDDLPLAVCAQIEQSIIIMNASFPLVRSFLENTSTGFVQFPVDEVKYNTSRGVGNSGLSYSGNTNANSKGSGIRISKKIHPVNIEMSELGDDIVLRDDTQETHITSSVERGDHERRSVRSYGSDTIMVRRSFDLVTHA